MGRKKNTRTRGAGTITELIPNEKYQIRTPNTYNHPRITRTITGTRKNAEKLLRELTTEAEQQELFVTDENITIEILAKQLQSEKLNLNLIQETTYYRNLGTLKMLSSISKKKIRETTATDIKTFLGSITNYSNSSIKKQYAMLKQTFNEAVQRKIVKENPMQFIKMPKSKQKKLKVRAFTDSERTKLYNILITHDIPYKEQMLLMLFSGMRMGEINALRLSDVKFNVQSINHINTFGIISVSKTISRGKKGEAILSDTTKTEAGQRDIPITKPVYDLITNYIAGKELNSEDFLFTKNGKLITTSQVYMQLDRILKKYDILDLSIDGKIDLHSLRHSFATLAIEAGMQAVVLQKLLGHKSIEITLDTYTDVFEKFQNDNLALIENAITNITDGFNDSEELQSDELLSIAN